MAPSPMKKASNPDSRITPRKVNAPRLLNRGRGAIIKHHVKRNSHRAGVSYQFAKSITKTGTTVSNTTIHDISGPTVIPTALAIKQGPSSALMNSVSLEYNSFTQPSSTQLNIENYNNSQPPLNSEMLDSTSDITPTSNPIPILPPLPPPYTLLWINKNRTEESRFNEASTPPFIILVEATT